MLSHKTLTLVFSVLITLPRYTAAHGYVQSIVVNGKSFPGFNPSDIYQNPAPAVAGWTAGNQDNGFVAPDGGDDVICHKNATPGQAYVTANAGDIVGFQWNTWPTSHHGPMLDYIASCDGECTTADKTTLSFAKLDAVGLISGSNPGTWGDDEMIANNFTWNLQLPTTLASGNYVIRHETIALHQAQQPDGAQLYPQCVNFKVTGTGDAVPSGVPGTQIYPDPSDPGLTFNLYTTFDSYTPPGPPVWSAAAPPAAQGAGGSAAPSGSAASSAPAASAASTATPTTMQTVASLSSAAAVATGESACSSKKKLKF
ncbi:hypothetical protein NA57DRAFT_77310 [Rhizodiscina lignyota]|uniref:Auxiliary Activity family 9 catalytic domain-containing protein n=1 Tax=Rhizodiscina lignyota TaxID=1504668 RepID=A0A9P4IC99_9PEZI|nr:hypothetical protein NA57DRAFT_77310 [Rhizodiscina lignyota]